MLRVGHRGAAALAPENTIESVRAAIEAGVDMIEFDVAPGAVVAHDPGKPGLALPRFLEELAELAPPPMEFLVDLKRAGYEEAALRACREAGLAERCTVSSPDRRTLALLAGRIRTSFTYPRHNPGPGAPVARALAAARWRATSANDMTVRHTLVSPALVATVHRAGGRVFAWTVNTPEGIERMEELGVDGVITDDPRLFRAKRVENTQETGTN
jgi:glycerophosphoryl diester phosphodiesterase